MTSSSTVDANFLLTPNILVGKGLFFLSTLSLSSLPLSSLIRSNLIPPNRFSKSDSLFASSSSGISTSGSRNIATESGIIASGDNSSISTISFLTAETGDPGIAVKAAFGDVAGGESRGFVFSGGNELALRSRGLGACVCSAGGEGIIQGWERARTSGRVDVIA